MTNIWGFLIQTIEVSIVAIILLFLKKLFQDKLSPRWQYGVWSVFLLSLLIPTGLFGFALFPSLRIFIEAIKTMIERLLQSSYTDIYLPIKNNIVFPFIVDIPRSITDFLFVIYVGGVLFWLIRYFIQYFHLKKLLLRYGEVPNEDVICQIDRIMKIYHFSPCQTIVFNGMPSAFVFGVLQPIFVLPSQELLDDKIILHELLHLKYRDSLHCVVWSCLRCLHWCNPFLQYVFNQINNDMESLCDQRVLERLEGEQRRDYGKILLAMTNEKYPHAFGTTSLSNGTQNIKKRIEAIVRFKKYPQGMTIVSLCICVLLAPLSLGYFRSYSLIGNPYDYNSFSYQISFASARIIEYRTMAGAIDTYAKGILSNDEQFLLSVLPQKYYPNYQNELRKRPDGVISNLPNYLYDVIHLEKINSHEYHAKLCFYNKNENIDIENNRVIAHYVMIPIQIIKERGWKVKQIGNVLSGDANYIETHMNSEIYEIPVYKVISLPCQSGRINIIMRNGYQVNSNDRTQMSSIHSFELRQQAQFKSGYQYIEVSYQNTQPSQVQEDIEYIYMSIKNLDHIDDNIEFESKDLSKNNTSGFSSNEESNMFVRMCSQIDKNLKLQHVSSYYDINKVNLPKAYALRIVIDGKEEIIKINVEDGEWYEAK